MSNRGRSSTADDEVDQLLRAAQDDVLLKLNVNSHIAHASASASIDPDLDRRFQALRKPQNPTKRGDDSRKPAAPKTDSGADKAADAEEDDDLFARFAALKNSLPSHNKNGNQRQSGDVLVMDEVKEEDSEDEVEKLVQWAIDAARLDPSPPSDDDADDDDDDDTDADDGDDKKGRRKKLTKK